MHQKSDESSDSYLTRCDVIWTELLARNMQLSELQACIMLRGSRLSREAKKRVLVDSGAETGGQLEVGKSDGGGAGAWCRILPRDDWKSKGQEPEGVDANAFVMDEVDEGGDHDVFLTAEDGWEDDYLETLAAENDEDATVVMQFEDAIMDTIASDQELSSFFSTLQDA